LRFRKRRRSRGGSLSERAAPPGSRHHFNFGSLPLGADYVRSSDWVDSTRLFSYLGVGRAQSDFLLAWSIVPVCDSPEYARSTELSG